MSHGIRNGKLYNFLYDPIFPRVTAGSGSNRGSGDPVNTCGSTADPHEKGPMRVELKKLIHY